MYNLYYNAANDLTRVIVTQSLNYSYGYAGNRLSELTDNATNLASYNALNLESHDTQQTRFQYRTW